MHWAARVSANAVSKRFKRLDRNVNGNVLARMITKALSHQRLLGPRGAVTPTHLDQRLERFPFTLLAQQLRHHDIQCRQHHINLVMSVLGLLEHRQGVSTLRDVISQLFRQENLISAGNQ